MRAREGKAGGPGRMGRMILQTVTVCVWVTSSRHPQACMMMCK